MSERDRFLDAIQADPNDDSVRLVFADWLDDHGDAVDHAHAELIRAQVMIESHKQYRTSQCTCAQCIELTVQVGSILREHGRAIKRRLCRGLVGIIYWDFHRGFPTDSGIESRAKPIDPMTNPRVRALLARASQLKHWELERLAQTLGEIADDTSTGG